jgi:hypothetical protein
MEDDSLQEFNISLFANRIARVTLSLLVAFCMSSCKSGNDQLTGGLFSDLVAPIKIASGDGQVQARGIYFGQPVQIQVSDNGSGVVLQNLQIEFTQTTTTDAVVESAIVTTDSSGYASTRILSPTLYNKPVDIEARIQGSNSKVTFHLSSASDTPASVDFVPGFAPPALYQASPTTPIPTFKVEVKDAFGYVIDTANSDSIVLSTNGGTGSLSGTTSAVLVNGVATFSAATYAVAETFNLRATHPGTGQYVEQSMHSFHGPAHHLVYTTQPSTPTVAGLSLGPVVEVRDISDNRVTTGSDSTALVTLSIASGSGVIAGTISKNAVNGVADFSSAGVYINLVGTKTIQALKEDTTSLGGQAVLTLVSNNVVITPAPIHHLGMTGPASSIAGVCHTFTVSSLDQYGNKSPVASDTAVSLAGSGADSFSSDSGCLAGHTITSTTILNGTDSALIYFQATTAPQLLTFAFDDGVGGMIAGTKTYSVVVAAGTKIQITGPTPDKSGTCSGPYNVTVEDPFGNPSDVAADTFVDLTGGSGLFYTAAGCGTAPVTQVNVVAGTNTLPFYFKDAVAETLSMTGVSAPLTGYTLPVQTAPNHFVVSGAAQTRSGDCVAVTVTTYDAAPNPANLLSAATVNLVTAGGTGAYYAAGDATCVGAPITSTSIASGAQAATVHYKNTVAANLTLTANDPSTYLASGSLSVANGPRSVFLTGLTPVRSGDCDVYTLTTKDSVGTAAGVLGATTFNLDDGVGAGDFYAAADTTCSGAPITSTAFLATASTGTVRFKDATAQSYVLTATDAAAVLIAGTENVVSGPRALTIAGAAAVGATQCTPMTITSRDAAGVASNVLSNTTFNLTDSLAHGAFYASADVTCMGAPITSAVMFTGTNAVTVNYKDASSEVTTLGVQDAAAYLLSGTTTIAIGPIKINIGGPAQLYSSQCGLYTATSQDGSSVAANVMSNTTVNLDDAGATGVFYAAADTTCVGAPITGILIANGTSSANFRYKDTKAEGLTISGTDAAAFLTTGTKAVSIGPDHLLLAGPSPIVAGACNAYSVTTKDTGNVVAGVLNSTVVTLDNGAASGIFYLGSDTTCVGAPITQVTFAATSSSVAFRFKDNVAESSTITADDGVGGLTAATFNTTAGPSKLIMTGVASAASGQCIALTVVTKDAANTPSNVLADTTVNLVDGAAAGDFYVGTDTTCVGGPIASALILNGTNTISVRYKDPKAEATTLTASDAAAILTTSNLSVTFGPDHFLVTGATPIRSGDCTVYTVTSKDTQNTASSVLSTTTVNITDGASSGVFYAAADTTCAGAPVSSISITSGTNNSTFRYMDLTAENATLLAADNAAVLTSATLPIVIGPRKLTLAGASTMRASECLSYTITTRDFANVAANVLSATQVNLTDAAAAGNFYASADTTCVGAPITNVSVASGAQTASFRYRDDVGESATLTLTDNAALLDPGSLGLTVGPVRVTIAGASPIRSGDCTVYTVTSRDVGGAAVNVGANTPIDVTDAAAAGIFYAAADTTCVGAPVTGVTISSGTSAATLRYKDNTAEAVTLTATDSTVFLASGTQNITVGPRKLVPLGPAILQAGVCQPMTVASRDFAGASANVLSATTVNLNDGAAAGVFYAAADVTCVGAPIASISITSGTNSAAYNYKDNLAENVTITADDASTLLDSGTLSFGVGPSQVIITGASPIRSGDCTAYTATLKDSSGNVTNALAPTSLTTLTDGTATGDFYAAADTTCVGAPITSLSIATGASAANFYWKDSTAEAITLTSDDGAGGLAAGTLGVTVGPRVLSLTGATPIRSGDCTLYTVTSKDAAGNTKNVLSTATVNISDAAAAGIFYAAADTTCSGAPVSSVSIAAGTSSSTFNYKDTTAEAITLTAADASALLVTSTLNITTGPQNYILTGASPVRAGDCTLYTITTKDSAGSVANALSALSVNVLTDGTATGDFYAAADTTCSGGIVSSVAIASGASSGQFRWKDTKAEAVTLSVDDGAGGLNPGTLGVTVGPDHIVITGASPVRATDCSLYTLTIKDTSGTTANVLSNTTINLSDAAAAGVFYDPADTTCVGGAITSRAILSGSSSASFRYKDPTGESAVLNADDAVAYLNSGTFNLTVGPSRLVMTGASPIRAGDCTAYTITSKDVTGNAVNPTSTLTVNLSGLAAGAFYATADTTCAGGTVTTATILTSANNVVVYYKDDTAQTPTLAAADAGASLTSTTLPMVVGPRKYVVTGTTPIRAGDCTLYTVTTKDVANNVANATSALNVNQLTDGTATGDFYALADTTCAGAPITSLSIASGASSAQFYYRDTVAESITLSVDDGAGGLDPGTLGLTLGPDHIVVTGNNPIRSGDCEAYTVTTKDVAGSAKNVLSATTITLSNGAGLGAFYASGDSTCVGGTVTTAPIASGTSATTIYYKDTTAQTVTLTIADQASSLTSGTLPVTVGPQKYILTGTASVRAGDCSLYTITTKDAANNTANALSALSVNALTDGTATGDFYAAADTTCSGGVITSVAIASGANSGQFRWRDTTGEAITLSVDDGAGGLNVGTLAVGVGPDRLVVSGATPIRSGDCTAYTITSKDTVLAAKNVTSTTTVNLTKSGSGAFYATADTTCVGGTITSTSITSGTNNVVVYYKDNNAESFTLTATDNAAYLTAGTLNVTTGPINYLLTGTSPIRAGDCSLYTITTKDAAGATANALSALSVNVLTDGTATGDFYAAADTTCSGGIVSSVAIASGASSGQFRWRDTTGESITLSADDGAGGLNPGTLPVVVGPDRLVVSGVTPIRSGDCTAYTITSKDTVLTAKNVTTATTVNLSKTGSGAFYGTADTTCVGGTITSTSIASGANNVVVYYKDMTAEAFILTAADNAAYLSSGTLNVTTGPLNYILTGATPIRAGDCTLYTITTKDAGGVTANALSALNVNALTDGTATGDFYAAADTTCSGGIVSSVAIASGASSGQFRWRDTKAEAVTLSVDDGAGGLNAGTLGVTVGPDHIVITGASPVRATDCSLYTVTIKDTSGTTANVLSNTTVNLSDAAAAGVFYDPADTTCVGGAITSQAILSGSSSASFRYKDPTGEAVILNADDAVAYLNSGTFNLSVGPSRLVMTGATPIRAGDCTAYTVTSKDVTGNAVNPTSTLTVNLSGLAAGAFYATADTTCVGGTVTTATILTSANNVVVYYKDNTAQTPTLAAADAGASLTSTTLPIVVGPRKYVVTGTTPIRAGDCTLYTVTTKDVANNVANALSALNVNQLTDGTATGDFYALADTTCVGGPISSLAIASGASSAQFYYRDTVAESITLSVDDGAGGLDPGTLALTLGPDHIVVTGNNPIRSGDCEAYTITTKDVAGSAKNVLSATTITLSNGAGLGAFYASGDSTCVGGTVTTAPIASGSSATTIYYKNTTAQAVTLTMADQASSLTSGTLPVTVGPQKYILTGTASIRAGDCSLYTITTKDAANNTANALSALSVNALTDGTATGDFYAAADTTCSGGVITSVSIASGANNGQFRWRDTTGEAITLSVDDGAGGLNAGTLAVGVGPDRLVVSGATPIRSGDCTAYTITSKDTVLATKNVTSLTTVNLTKSGAGAFYATADTTCVGGTITSTSIASGANNVVVYYKDNTAEAFTLTATDNAAYLTAGTLNVTTGPQNYILTGTSPIRAGDCSLYTITTKDAAGATANALSALSVNALTDGTATGDFYAAADTTCAGGIVSSVAIASGASSGQFRWRDTTGESITLSVDDGAGGLNPGTLPVVVGPDRLVVSGATPIRSGDCTAYTITSKDTVLTAKNVTTATTVNLSKTGAGAFYGTADTTCVGGTITSTSIASGANNVVVYYKDTTAEAFTLTAADNAAYLSSGTLNVTAGPLNYILTGASPIRAGDCTLYTITTKDAAGVTANALSALNVNALTDGTASGDFYAAADTTCTGGIVSSVAISSGASSAQFRWRDTKAESITLTVDDGAGGLNAGSLPVTVGPDHIVITGTSPIRAGDCSLYTITIKDTSGTTAGVLSNTTVNVSDAAALGNFYAPGDTTCAGGTITSQTILSGANSASFRYKDLTGESLTLNADDAVAYLNSGTLPLTVGPDHLVATGTSPIRAGDCTAYTITSKDLTGVAKNVTVATTVNLTGIASGNFYATADTTCVGGTVTTTSIASGANNVVVYYKDDTAQTPTLAFVDNAAYLASTTLPIVVGPRKYVITGTTPVKASDCTLFTVTTKDVANNVANALSALTINQLTDASATGNFYDPSDTTCTGGVINTLSIASGASSTTFRYKDTAGEAITLSVDDGAGGLDPGTFNLTVGPDHLSLTGATPIRSGDCTAYTVTSKDTSNVSTNVTSLTTVNLTKTGLGAFYATADTTCVGGSITSTSIASGSNNVVVYYKDNTAEVFTLTATDNAAALTASNLGVTTGPQKYIVTGTTPIRAGDCSLYTITTKDAANNTANALSALSVNALTDGTATGDFYAAGDTTCSAAVVTSVAIGSGTSSGQFRWRDTTGESITLSVDDGAGGLNAGTLGVVVGPDRLVVSGVTPIRSGDCTPYTITSEDTVLAAKNVTSTTTVNLTTSGAGLFYGTADTTCVGGAITSTSIASGANNVVVYYKNNTAQVGTLTATDNAAYLTAGTLNLTTGPQKYILTGTSPIRAGDCSLYTITTKDANNVTTNALSALSVNALTDGTATGDFYAAGDTTCVGGLVTSVSIASGSSSGQFRWKDTTGESITLSVDDGAGGLNVGTLPVVVGPDRLVVTGPPAIRAGDCTAFTVTSNDTVLTAKNVTTVTTVNLTGAASGAFYGSADTTCAGGAVTSISMASGTSTQTFYYLNLTSQAVTLSAADNAAYLSTGTLAIGVGPVKYVLTGSTPIKAGTCNVYTITTQDANNVASNALTALTVNSLVDGSATGNFYAAADTTCSGGAITNVTVGIGTSTQTFRWMDPVAATVTLTVDDGAGGLNPGSLNVTLGPDRIDIAGNTTEAIGACQAYTLTTRDAALNAANVLANTTINLTDGSATGDFYDTGDPTCVGATITSKQILSGANNTTVYYKDSVTEVITLQADDNAASLASDTQVLEVGADHFEVTGPASARAGDCGLYTVNTKNASNVLQPVLQATTANLTGGGTGVFYAAADTTCVGGAVTSVPFSVGTSSVQFNFKDNKAEVLTFNADDGAGGRTAGTLPVSIGPKNILITGAAFPSVGVCTAYTITTKDLVPVASGVLTGTTVNLSGGGSGQFYDVGDATCAGPTITSVAFLATQSSKIIYFNDATSETLTLTATDNAAYLTAGTLPVETGADRLSFTGPSPVLAATCNLYTVTMLNSALAPQNVLANATVNLAGNLAGSYYAAADTTCVGGTITNVIVGVGTSSQTFRFKDNTAQGLTLTSASTSRTSSNLAVTVGPDRLITTGASSIVAGSCNLYTVNSKDALPVNANVLSLTTVNLDDGGAAGNFYAAADATCTGGVITNVTIANGANVTSFRYKDATSEALTLSVTDNAALLTSSSFPISVGPSKIILTGATPIRSGICTAYTVTTQDASSVASNVLAATTINLSAGAGSGTFYATGDSTCVGGAVTSQVMGIGTSTKTFYYKDDVAETATLTASDAGAILTSGPLTVTSAARAITIAGTSPVLDSTCNLYTITSRDNSGTATNVASSRTIDLTGGGAGAFYAAADTTCVGAPVTSAVIGAGTNTATFRFKDLTAQSVTITGTDASLNLDVGTVNVAIAPHLLTVAGSAALPTGACQLYTVTAKDGNATTANVLSTITVNLSDAGAPGVFYAAADTTCVGGAITNVSITSGTSSTTYRYMSTSTMSGTLTMADAAAAMTSATLAIAVGPSKLKITGSTPIVDSTCPLFTVTSQDSSNVAANVLASTTVNLSGAGAGAFYAAGDTTCAGGTVTTATISSGASTTTFRFKDLTAESVTFTAADAGAVLTSSTYNLAIGPHLLTASGPSTALAGTCLLYTITAKDGNATTSNVLLNKTVNLSDGASPGVFYAAADTTCVGGAITNVVILNGANTITFRYKSTAAMSGTINMDDAGAIMTSATAPITVGPNKLAITGTTPINDTTCSLFSVVSQDATSAAATVAANTTVNLTATGSGLYYDASDTTCVGAPITSVQINSGTSSSNIRYMDGIDESLTLTATDAGAVLATGNLPISVVDGCVVNNYLVEVMQSGSPTSTVLSASTFDVRLTARDVGNATRTCLNKPKTVTWTMNGTTATADCGASGGAPVAPTQTTFTFVNGVYTTTTTNAKFFTKEATANVHVNDGTAAGTSANVTVGVGAVCRIQLRTAATNGGSVLGAQSIDLNIIGTTPTSKVTAFAAGYDTYGNYVADQTVVWSGDNVVNPLKTTTTATDDTASVTGVKIGTGTLQADYAGGGTYKTATAGFTVSSTNPYAAWTSASNDTPGSTLVGAATVQATHYWDTTADAVTAWKAAGTQSWFSETFAVNVRHARKEFPDKVILTGTSNGLDIVDATSNRLWMRFNGGANKIIDTNFGTVQSVAAINGKIFVAIRNAGVTGSLVVIDLANDSAKRYSTSGEYTWSSTIVNRNTSGTWSLANAGTALASNLVYQVDARRVGGVDYALIGTALAANLYQDNAGTVSIYKNSTAGAVTAVKMSSTGQLYYGDTGIGLHRVDPSLPLAADFTPLRTYDLATTAELQSLAFNSIDLAEGTSAAQAGSHTVLVGTDGGMAAIHEHSTFGSSISVNYSYKGTGSTAFKGAMDLDGVNDYATVASGGSNLTGTGGATVEFWFRPDVTISAGMKYLYARGTGNNSLVVRINAGKVEFVHTTSAGTVTTLQSTATSWTAGTWHHFAGVITSAGIEQWIDGADHKTAAIVLTGQTISNVTTVLGADAGNANRYNGMIDELRVSKVARYSGATFTVPAAAFTSDASTIQLIHFDEGSGVSAAYSDTDAAQAAALVGNARLTYPILTGSSEQVAGVASVVVGANFTAHALTKGATGAWTELTNAQSGTSVSVGGSRTGLNGLTINIFQVDSLTNSDILTGTTGGVGLERR